MENPDEYEDVDREVFCRKDEEIYYGPTHKPNSISVSWKKRATRAAAPTCKNPTIVSAQFGEPSKAKSGSLPAGGAEKKVGRDAKGPAKKDDDKKDAAKQDEATQKEPEKKGDTKKNETAKKGH